MSATVVNHHRERRQRGQGSVPLPPGRLPRMRNDADRVLSANHTHADV